MLSAGQSAGNILYPFSPFVSAKRAQIRGSQLAGTVEVNPTTSRSNSRDLPSTRAQAEGLRVDPERRFFTRLQRQGLAPPNGSSAEIGTHNRLVGQTKYLPASFRLENIVEI